jgi:hypothetical protein
MKSIVNIFCNILGKNLSKTIISVCEMLKSLFQFKKTSIQNKLDDKKTKKIQKLNKKIDEVIDIGTIENLLDLRDE